MAVLRRIDTTKKRINYVKKRCLIIDVDSEISEKAVEISMKNKISMADSIIYTTALIKKCKVLTLDNDFRGLEKFEKF